MDIAISIDQNGNSIPFIFAEVKVFASGIATATEQLKFYMKTDDNVQYGIATDGVDITIINRYGEQVDDVPFCQPRFLPDTQQTRVYKDFRHDQTYHYVQDMDDEQQVDVIDPATELSLNTVIDKEIPVLGDIAAGIPTTAIQDFDETILLPAEWIIQTSDTYALRVTGDSMIDAGIDKGDLAITINKQQQPIMILSLL